MQGTKLLGIMLDYTVLTISCLDLNGCRTKSAVQNYSQHASVDVFSVAGSDVCLKQCSRCHGCVLSFCVTVVIAISMTMTVTLTLIIIAMTITITITITVIVIIPHSPL